MATTAIRRPGAGSTENESVVEIFNSGKLRARVYLKKDAIEGDAAQDQTDIGQTTITDLLGLTPHTVTTLS